MPPYRDGDVDAYRTFLQLLVAPQHASKLDIQPVIRPGAKTRQTTYRRSVRAVDRDASLSETVGVAWHGGVGTGRFFE